MRKNLMQMKVKKKIEKSVNDKSLEDKFEDSTKNININEIFNQINK